MNLNEKERMMLTVRINRAKGQHVALKMHELVTKLYTVHRCTMEELTQGLGMSRHEVELLLKDGVFDLLETSKAKYSNAWVPEKP